jgi:hypothetical protein
MDDKKYYAQYLYGTDFKIISPRSEALGEALCVLFNISDAGKQSSLVENVPVTAYGIPCIYPQIPNIAPYHNNAVWPFVQSYWALASAKAGNEQSVMESLSAIWRPAALFVTNKENFVADNGDFAGTVINSSNMLWSLSGSLAMVHRVLFGIEFQANKLVFHPFVPKALQGNRSLNNFKYRKAVLDISMEGFGNKIKSFLLDGKSLPVNEIPATLSGRHTLKIILANTVLPKGNINKVDNYTSPAVPLTSNAGKAIMWQTKEGEKKYKVLKNGVVVAETTAAGYRTVDGPSAAYQVIAVDEKGVESFASEPLLFEGSSPSAIYEIEKFVPGSDSAYKGANGGFVEIAKNVNTSVNIPITINEAGVYSINFRYANGNGPVNTENKCAIRALSIDKKITGTVIFPQRGKGEWSNGALVIQCRQPCKKVNM